MADRRPKFLPLLGPNSPNPDDEGRWHRHDGGLNTLAKYADSLRVGGVEAPPEQLKSVPTPWARLVVFEHALFEDEHPAHDAVVQEWRGLLGCLALQQYERLEVEATGVDLDRQDGVVPDLRAMLADPDDDRWDRLGLIRVDDVLVGGTSPRTLLFTGIRDNVPRTSVQWQEADRLIDPAKYYFSHHDRMGLVLLDRWLESIISRFRETDELDRLLGRQPASDVTEGPKRVTEVLEQLDEWRREVGTKLDELGGSADEGDRVADSMGKQSAPVARAFHSGTLAHDVYSVLVPVPFEAERENDLRLRNGEVVLDPGEGGLLVDADTGRPFTGQIRLATGGSREVQEGKLKVPVTPDQLGARVVDPGQHFADGLVEVENVSHDNMKVLEGNADYLFPFRTELVEELGPDNVTRAEVVDERSGGVKVRLTLPLERDGLHLQYDRVYQQGDVVDGYASPALAIWPDFVGPEWEHYCYFQRSVVRAGADELDVSPALLEPRESYVAPGRNIEWGETERPVRAWAARAHRTRGLLFTNVAGLDQVDRPQHEWDISVDFGSTHTRVYRSRSTKEGEVEPEPISFSRRAVPLLQGVGSLPVCFFPAPDNEVGSQDEPRSLVQLPLERIPTDRDDRGFPARWLPPDGIVYWRSLLGDTIPDGLRTNLKWHERESEDAWAFQAYLTQVYLMASAEAAADDRPATVRSITPAYPSVFPNHLRVRHENLWEEIGERYDVEIRDPMMESIALAEYLTHVTGEAVPAANLLAVDVGGSTADIAVWAGSNRRVGSESVRVAGGLMTRLLGTDERAREAVRQAAAGPGIRRDVEWTGDRVRDGLRFAALLRYVEREKGSTRALADNLFTGRGSDGERVIAHAGYLYAVLSYLLGMMVRKDEVEADTYRIHFGGHGSGFLRWLNALGADTHIQLPRTFFEAALDPDDGVDVQISLSDEHAKEEVGQGLLSASEEAWDLNRDISQHRHRTFLGESGLPGTDGDRLEWTRELRDESLEELAEPDRPLPLSSYEHLMSFLEPFRTGETPLGVIGDALGLRGDILDADLRDRLHQRLYGADSAWSRWNTYRQLEEDRRGRDDVDRPDLLLEPFFVVEARTLLEYTTGNEKLFGA